MHADEAIVLVGGLGTRLRGVVSDLPKPLAPIAGRPFLAWVLDELAAGDIRHVILATGHLSGKIERAIGSSWSGLTIDYSVETEPLGTGGAIRQACRLLRGESAHVLNGDTFLRYSPRALQDLAARMGADIGMALAAVPDVGRYGAVDRRDGHVLAFLEKGGTGPGLINAGCYYLTASAIASLPARKHYSFETEVLAPAAAAGQVCGFSVTSGFIDIGVPEDYARAQTVIGSLS